MSKLIVVVGATGAQGGSVAKTFSRLPGWKVRGISRDPTSSAAQGLTQEGVEVVKGDLDDKGSLLKAFTGAHLIFANTDFFIHLFTALYSESVLQGRSPQKYAYDREVEQGVNIAEVAASPAVLQTLELFVWSNLSDPTKFSHGKYTKAFHYETKVEVVRVIETRLPELAQRMSLLQLGQYHTNWYMAPPFKPQKQVDGSFVVKRPFKADSITPFVYTQADTGKFVEALSKAAPGTHLLGTSEEMTWLKYTETWGRVLGVETQFEYVPTEELFVGMPQAMIDEMIEPFAYVAEFGWDGGDPTVVSPQQLGVEGLTTVEQYIRGEDWSSVL